MSPMLLTTLLVFISWHTKCDAAPASDDDGEDVSIIDNDDDGADGDIDGGFNKVDKSQFNDPKYIELAEFASGKYYGGMKKQVIGFYDIQEQYVAGTNYHIIFEIVDSYDCSDNCAHTCYAEIFDDPQENTKQVDCMSCVQDMSVFIKQKGTE